MIFSLLWIIPRVVFIIFFLMGDSIFNYGATPCAGHQTQSNGNSSTGTGGYQSHFFNYYLKSVLEKSKALEEAIYSDILNNLRNLVKSENNQSGESGQKEEKTHDVRGKNEDQRNKGKGNKGDLQTPVNSAKNDMFVIGEGKSEEVQEGKREGRREGNVTISKEPQTHGKGYLLAYSGNPFGSRRSIAGIVQVPDYRIDGREVGDPRKKRSVLLLYNMVLCTTGCNPFAYKGYGCYCGFLGSGFVVDGIDSCCKMHDWCYNSAGCPMFLEYFIPYLWQCHHRQPLCAIDHGYYGGPGSCAQRLCECDRQLALCLRRFPCPSTKALCTSSPWRLLQNVLML